jgi:type I restriction enzyme S subunit
MSHYKPYPAYQESDVIWQQRMPSDWQSLRLKYLFSEKKKKIAPNFPCGAISFGNVVFKDSEAIPDETRQTYQEVLSGDFLVNPINLNYDLKSLRTALSKIDVCVSPAYIVLRKQDESEKSFLKYLLYCFDTLHMKTLGAGVRQTINFEDIGGCYVFLPTLSEQLCIAETLDRETGRIDALVVKKTRFIDLLREKRQALITHAVTKGLDPNVKMKDSGVEWLGEVPKHWTVLPIKWIANVGNGSTPSRENFDYWTNGNYPWLNSSVVNQETVTCAEEFVTQLALKECHLPIVSPPAVLIGITGQGRTRGMATTLAFEATINQHVAFVKPNPNPNRMIVEYLRRVFDMAYQYLRDDSDGGGSTKGAITCEQISGLPIPVPNIEEQRLIAAYIDSNATRLDALIQKTEHSITLLKERRSALITAAVTGQIDLRETL